MRMKKIFVQYILIFFGILIFMCGYFLVYLNYVSNTEALNAEIATLSDELDVLEGYEAQLEQYKAEIEKDQLDIDTQLKKYTSLQTPEDFIMLATEFENSIGFIISNMSFSEPEALLEIAGVADTTDMTEPTQSMPLISYRMSTMMEGELSYNQIKELLAYITKQHDITTLDNLELSYDGTTGLIHSSFILDKYYITGRDIEDHKVNVPYSALGKDVLMGT